MDGYGYFEYFYDEKSEKELFDANDGEIHTIWNDHNCVWKNLSSQPGEETRYSFWTIAP